MAPRGNRNNAVEYVISARDAASKVIAGVSSTFGKLGVDVEALNKRINALTNERRELEFQTNADEVRERIDGLIEGLEDRRLRLDIDEKIAKAKIAQIDADVARLEDQRIKLQAENATEPEIKAVEARIQGLEAKRLKLQVDSQGVQKQLSDIDTQLAGLEDEKINVEVNAQAALTRIREIDGELDELKRQGGGLGAAFDSVKEASKTFFFLKENVETVLQALGTARAAAEAFYNTFIQSNVELQEQLLATQASLAATNTVLVGGVEIEDPTEAIQALEAPVRAALEQIRQDSLELVGVTSADLIPIFQVLAQESSNIGANLSEAGDLTVSFAAALGTLGIPLEQQRQEIQSILTAQISSDSQLAKSIGLNNEQVKLWQQQGTLVENLGKRLEAFRAGNALAAQTIGGITSNIAEIFQEVTRIAGEPLLEPIVQQLERFYQFLEDNRDTIQDAVGGVIDFLVDFGDRAIETFNAILPAIQELGGAFFQIAEAVGPILGDTILGFVDSLTLLAQVIAPVVGFIGELVGAIAAIAESGIAQIAVQLTQITGALQVLAPFLPGVSSGLDETGEAVEETAETAADAVADVELLGNALQDLERSVAQAQSELDRAQLRIDVDQSKQIAELNEQLAKGLISQKKFEDDSRQITEQGLEQRLQVVSEKAEQLRAEYEALGDDEKAQAKETLDQILQLEQEQANLQTEVLQDQIEREQKLLEDAQQEAIATVKAAETERQIELQKLRNKGLISEEELQEELAEASLERIQGELKAEERKFKQIKRSRGANSKEAREAQQRVLDLTKEALEEEKRLQDAQFEAFKKEVNDRALAVENAGERQNQVLQEQLDLYDAINSAINQSSNLLGAAANLQAAQTNSTVGRLGIIAELTRNESEQQRIRQAAAIAELEGLKEAQAIENATLEIELAQQEIALERLKIENEIALTKQQAAIAQLEAEAEIAQMAFERGDITQNELDSSLIALEGAQKTLSILQKESGLLQRQSDLLPLQQNLAREAQRTNQEAQIDQARLEVVRSAPPSQQRRLERELRNDLLDSNTRNLISDRGGLRNASLDAVRGQDTNVLDRVDPDRVRTDEVLATVAPLAEVIPALGNLEGLTGGQQRGNELLGNIETGINSVRDGLKALGNSGGGGSNTFNVTVNASSDQPQAIADALQTQFESIVGQMEQLSNENR